MFKIKDVNVRDHFVFWLLMTVWWVEGLSHLCLSTAHPVLQEVARPRTEVRTEGRPGAEGRLIHPQPCPHPSYFKDSPDSQSASPTQVLLSFWVALGSQQNQRGRQPPLTTHPASRPLPPVVHCSCSAPSPTPPHHHLTLLIFLLNSCPHPWLQFPFLSNPWTHTSLSWSLTYPACSRKKPGPGPTHLPVALLDPRLSSAGKSPHTQEVWCLHQCPASNCLCC